MSRIEDIHDLKILFKNELTIRNGFFSGRIYSFRDSEKSKTKNYKLEDILLKIKEVGPKTINEKIPDIKLGRERAIYEILNRIKIEELSLKKIPNYELQASPIKKTLYKIIRFFKDLVDKNYFKTIDKIEQELLPPAKEDFVFLRDVTKLNDFNKSLKTKANYTIFEDKAKKIYGYDDCRNIIKDFKNAHNSDVLILAGKLENYKSKPGALEALLIATLAHAKKNSDIQLYQDALLLILPKLANSPLVKRAVAHGDISLSFKTQ